MPTYSPYTSTFDLTFDYTFQNLLNVPGIIAADDCRMPGVFLHWLSHRGWCSYLFQGNSDEGITVTSTGQLEKGGLLMDAQRVGMLTIVTRAGGLTKPDSSVIRTIFTAPRIYALAPNPAGIIKACPVYIETGSYPIWNESSNRMNVEFTINLPKFKSQRV